MIELNAQPYTIIGVMPESFALRMRRTSGSRWAISPGQCFSGGRIDILEVVGRLRDGVTPRRAELELNTIARRAWAADQFMKDGWTLQLTRCAM